MTVHQDPGWGPAIKLGFFGAIFNRTRVMSVRPAIVAARAMVLPGVLNAVLIGLALGLLGERGANGTAAFAVALAAGTVVGLGGVLITRNAAEGQPGSERSPQEVFVSRVTLMSALANLPLVAGLIGFFVGGGFLSYYLGVALTMAMLWGLVRPTEEMAERFGAVMKPPMTGEELWARMLEPA